MIYFAGLMLILAGFTWLRSRVGTPISMEEQGDFVMMARTSPAVLELDPRIDAEEGDEDSGEARKNDLAG